MVLTKASIRSYQTEFFSKCDKNLHLIRKKYRKTINFAAASLCVENKCRKDMFEKEVKKKVISGNLGDLKCGCDMAESKGKGTPAALAKDGR